jgi:hypothetical protein
MKPFYRVFQRNSPANWLCDSRGEKGSEKNLSESWPFFPASVAWLENRATPND